MPRKPHDRLTFSNMPEVSKILAAAIVITATSVMSKTMVVSHTMVLTVQLRRKSIPNKYNSGNIAVVESGFENPEQFKILNTFLIDCDCYLCYTSLCKNFLTPLKI